MTSPDLDTLTPDSLARYLASTGWTERQQAPHMSVWSTSDDGYEILLPLDQEFRDYHARLHDALQTIALSEDRDSREVLADVAATTVDTQHFRLLPNSPSGTIRLVDVVDVTRGVRDLMYTAAHATVLEAPALVQPRPRPPQVNTFVRSVLLVAPRPGSFVLSAHVPVHAGAEPQPFNRQVVLQLHKAVRAVHAAAVQAIRLNSVDPFLERAEDGVSANLCEAMALIGGTQPFDLRFAWAASMPSTRAVTRFSFDRRLVRSIQTAARDLPRHAAESQVVLTGQVTQLERDAQGSGRVTLRGTVDVRVGHTADMNVKATLPRHMYELAVDAHRRQRQVKVVGTLRGSEFDRVTRLDIQP